MLEGRIYIESFDSNDDFSVSNDYYSDENSYINALNSLMAENNSLFDGIGGEGCMSSYFEHKEEQKIKKNSYVSCQCMLSNENMDSFIYHNVNGESFQLEISLKLSEETEDFEYEYKSWRDYHNKVFKLLSKDNSMDILLSELPNKDLKFSFTNFSGGLSYALLEGCVIISADINRLVIRVNKLTFIKCLD